MNLLMIAGAALLWSLVVGLLINAANDMKKRNEDD